jgi:hypothetical protein
MQFNPAISTRGSFFILASPSHAPRISMRLRIYSLLPHFVIVVASDAIEDHDGFGYLGHGRISSTASPSPLQHPPQPQSLLPPQPQRARPAVPAATESAETHPRQRTKN